MTKLSLIKQVKLLIILIVLSFFLFACAKDETLKPTKAFYVNDFADTLLPSTKYFIYSYSKYVYEESSNIDSYVSNGVDGTQVVIMTYKDDPALIDTTKIFNNWQIGKNDLGILIILYFTQEQEDLVYQNLSVEIGLKMSTYLSAFEVSEFIDEAFDENYISNFDEKLIVLYLLIMGHIYEKVYDYQVLTGNPYPYDELYEDYMDTQYTELRTIPQEDSGIFSLMPWWGWLSLILIFFFLGIRYNLFYYFLNAFIFRNSVPNKGGGGKSIGYWFKK